MWSTTLQHECKTRQTTGPIAAHVASNSQIGCACQQLRKLAMEIGHGNWPWKLAMESVRRTEQDILCQLGFQLFSGLLKTLMLEHCSYSLAKE